MSKAKKAVRWILKGAGVLAALAVAVYLLRWPLFGGRVRGEIAKFAEKNLQADVSFTRLGGSLLWGIEAEGVELRPRPGSPVRAGTVRSASVSYGFLGRSPFWIDARGAEIEFAPKPGPRPPVHETVRDAVPVLRSLRFDGRVRVTESGVVLPDGRRLDIADGQLEGDEARVSLRTGGFGAVTLASHRSDGGAILIEGEAKEGPVRSARVEMGRLEGLAQSLKIAGAYKDQSIAWEGTLACDGQGRPTRAQGRLAVPQGRADSAIDLVAGRVRLDIDGTVPVREPLRADVELRCVAEGPLEGPIEGWTFSNVAAKTRNASFESLKIDYAEASCFQGTLSRLVVKAGFSAGKDHAEVEGVVRWKGALELDLSGRAEAEGLEPYFRLLAAPPSLKASGVRVAGSVRIAGGAVSFDGTAESAAGSFDSHAWESLRLSGTYSAEKIVAREILARGTALAPVVTGKGSVEGELVEAELEGGPDRVTLKGSVSKGGDFKGEFSVDGPCLWLKALGTELPGWVAPLHAKGRASREGGLLRATTTLSGGGGLAAAPEIVARGKDGTWTVDVGAGTVTLPGTNLVEHGPFTLDIKEEGASVPDLQLVLRDPAVKARLSASLKRSDRGLQVALDARELEAWGIRLESLVARGSVSRVTGEASVDVRWGREGGPAFEATGLLGRENDFHVLVRAPDLRDPFVRKLLGGIAVEGGASADLHVYGTIDRPDATGTLSLEGITAQGWRPVSIVLPVRTEEGTTLRAWVEDATPYGKLALDARVSLPWIEPKPRVDLVATLVTEDLAPFVARLEPTTTRWIPPGKATLEAHLRGPIGTLVGWVEGKFESARFKPPEPLGEVKDFRIAARFDETGLQVSSVEGRLGGGAFQGKGLWEVWKEDRPLALHVTGDELLVVDDPLARIRIKPDVTLHHASKRGLWLDGFVEVPFVLYHREFGAGALGAEKKAAPIAANVPRLRLIPLASGGFRIPGIEGLEELALDLGFRTTGEFRVENSIVGALLGAEGRLRGTGAVPALSGWVRTKPRHGEVRAGPGAFLRIESSMLTLPAEPGKEASIRFEGRMGSGQDQITILIAGPPDHATLTLVSDPPKDQKELLAILGQKVAIGTLTGQLTPGISDEWPTADRKESFLSKLAPTVVPGETPGQKRQPWELPAVGTARGTVVRTEYIYNKYFSILAETDREADVSGDVKLRIRF